MGMAAGRNVGGMERSEDYPPAVELPFAAAPVKSRSRNRRREPRPGADPGRKIVQPAGNLPELCRTRNSARRHQQPEPTVEHGSAARNGHGKSSHRARRGQLVESRIFFLPGFARGSCAWGQRRERLSRTLQYGSFQRSPLESPREGTAQDTATLGSPFF